MRILHIMNWFMEGMGYQENYLPFHQAELRNQVSIFCSKHFLKKRNIFKKTDEDINYAEVSLNIKRLDSIYIQFMAEQNWYLNLSRAIENFGPEVIHLHDVWALPSVQFVLTKFTNKNNIKVFIDSHIDNGNFDFKSPQRYIYYFWLIKKIIIPLMLRENFNFLAVNPYARYCLEKYFRIPDGKIKFLPLGIDSRSIYFLPSSRQELRQKYGINKDDIVFVFSGVFERSKSLSDLLTAFKLLEVKYSSIFLLLIGAGNSAKDKESELLQKKGKIIFTGWLSRQELYRWYSVADIGIMPGKLGGIRDVLATGRPLIVNDDLAVSYLVEYGNGLIFQRGNIKELVRAMDTYIRNPDLIQRHGERALRLVTDKLSWQIVAQNSLQMYNECSFC